VDRESSELGPNSVATVRSVSGASSTISPLRLTAIGVYTKSLTDPKITPKCFGTSEAFEILGEERE
jgi:hypothetical protein